MSEALAYLDEVVADQQEEGEEGEGEKPYDGIVGFSQGASVAASWLSSRSLASLKFAVFLCAALVPPSKARTVQALEESIGSLLAREGEKLDLPTLHVIGERDVCFGQSERLVGNCEARMARKVVVAGGGHDVPRDGAVCEAIARAVERVAFEGISRQ
jgi:pimeloyl-ACP methyl ester carboxylesterase